MENIEEPMVYVKIHKKGNEVVVGAADCDIIGCCFRDQKCKIDVREAFYKGDTLPVSEAVILLSKATNINVVGKNIVNALLEAKVVNEHNVMKIGDTLFAMKIVV
jgi:hypothetical protein